MPSSLASPQNASICSCPGLHARPLMYRPLPCGTTSSLQNCRTSFFGVACPCTVHSRQLSRFRAHCNHAYVPKYGHQHPHCPVPVLKSQQPDLEEVHEKQGGPTQKLAKHNKKNRGRCSTRHVSEGLQRFDKIRHLCKRVPMHTCGV